MIKPINQQGKTKSKRNKTIDIGLSTATRYLGRCVYESDVKGIASVKNKTVIGDSMRILRLMPLKSVDLLIADPCYNLTKEFHGMKFTEIAHSEYEKYTLAWIDEVAPILKPNASLYVCCDWKSSMVVGPSSAKRFAVVNRITWQREKGRGATSNWKSSSEDIWFATVNPKRYTFNVDKVMSRRRVIALYRQGGGEPKGWEETAYGNFRSTYPSNFWDDITVHYWSMPENTAHPTQKPEKLIAKLILASTNPGDFVLDPFLGSGTTSVVAKNLGEITSALRRTLFIVHGPNIDWNERSEKKKSRDLAIGYFGKETPPHLERAAHNAPKPSSWRFLVIFEGEWRNCRQRKIS